MEEERGGKVVELEDGTVATDMGEGRCGGCCGGPRKPAVRPPTVPLTRVLWLLRTRNRIYMVFGW